MKRLIIWLFSLFISSGVAVSGFAQSPVTLKAYQQATLKFRCRDKKQNTAPCPVTPVWSLSKPGVVSLAVDANGLGAKATWLTGPDAVAITVQSTQAIVSVININTLAADPVDGEITVEGIIDVTFNYSDDVGVTRVALKANDMQVGEVLSPPPDTTKLQWDTSMVPPGSYILRGEAEDAAGNIGQSMEVRVAVKQ